MHAYRSVGISEFDNGIETKVEFRRIIAPSWHRVWKAPGKIVGTILAMSLALILTLIGVIWLTRGHKGYTPMLTIGFLTLLPGAYGFYHIVAMWRGWRGFEGDDLPVDDSTDEEWTFQL
jgi:hypothetical protein